MVSAFLMSAKNQDFMIKYSDFLVAWQRYGTKKLQNLRAKHRFHSKLKKAETTSL